MRAPWLPLLLCFAFPPCTPALPGSRGAPGGGHLPFLGVSSACQAGLQDYITCSAKSGLFAICSNKAVLNSTTTQELLGCLNKSLSHDQQLKVCQKHCEARAGILVNSSVVSPCSPDLQAMQSFTGAVNLFTVGNVDSENISTSIIMPFPNMKSAVGGATYMQLGTPGKCAEIPTAQYCVLSGLLDQGFTKVSFLLGNCLPKACGEEELKATLEGIQGSAAKGLKLNLQCNLVRPLGTAEGVSKQMQDQLGWGGIPVEYPNERKVTGGFVGMLCLTIALVALVAVGTILDWRRESRERRLQLLQDGHLSPTATPMPTFEIEEPLAPEVPVVPERGAVEVFLNHWSLLRNSRSFMRLRPADKNPYACMDAIRTLAMAQVILGHMFVYPFSSSGLSNMEQFNPPHGLMGSFWFMLIPGCFYGVDSFFLLSGFLCCDGLQRKHFSKPENKTYKGFLKMYPMFLVSRVLRLLPLEMFCIALSYNVLPYLGTGVLWNLDRPGGGQCSDGSGSAGCQSYWWTNVFFLQDLDAYLGKCYGHTWYLANDMQLYLTAPFFTFIYSKHRFAGWLAIVAGILVGVVSPMIITAQQGFVPDALLASAPYEKYIYMKPWCRCTPFFVGIALGWLWQERLEAFTGRHVSGRGRRISLAFSSLAIALCFLSVFGRLLLYQCDLLTCASPDKNPAGKFFQYAWVGGSILCWSVGLGTIMVLCFCGRFLPLIQNFLNQSFWQPFAKLSYSCYLIHTSVLIMDYCSRDSPVTYSLTGYVFSFLSFVTAAMMAAYVLFMLVEKPLANLQMKVLRGGGD